MSRDQPPRQIRFDPTAEIFATDSGGSFLYPLAHEGEKVIETLHFDEARFVFSIWSPSANVVLDLDRTYVELRACFDPDDEHWVKLAEIEPVVPPYGAGDSFDGWIVLPVLAEHSSFALFGSGFDPRSRLQIRASAFFVS
ncbi:MAG: hypothetical protein MI919_22745 [Holophagales bacterium]|nr:hypothetical protein [Holophagales bacterium]